MSPKQKAAFEALKARLSIPVEPLSPAERRQYRDALTAALDDPHKVTAPVLGKLLDRGHQRISKYENGRQEPSLTFDLLLRYVHFDVLLLSQTLADELEIANLYELLGDIDQAAADAGVEPAPDDRPFLAEEKPFHEAILSQDADTLVHIRTILRPVLAAASKEE